MKKKHKFGFDILAWSKPKNPVIHADIVKTKYTPGPWVLNKNPMILYYKDHEKGKTHKLKCWGTANSINDTYNGDKVAILTYRTLDNHNLIVAAPELLDVCKEAEAQSRQRRPLKKDTWLKLCAVIAKAEGGK